MPTIAAATKKSYAEIEIEAGRDPRESETDRCDFIKATSLPKGLRLRITKDENLSEEGQELVKEGILEIQ